MPCLCVCSCVPFAVCVCVCVCMRVRKCVCLLEVMRKMLNEVLSCIDVISSIYCALGCVYILLTILFLYCALQAHIRCKCFTSTFTLYYILSLLF